ncbi:MAG: BACON domain-containing protein [Marinifilaceae bacterium]|nr:BACON domain-containing protein [Marinifilaceae bacterium]
MKAKQFISFLMASAMVVSFAACSDDDEDSDPVPPQSEQTPGGGNEDQPGGGNEDQPGTPEGPAPIHSLSKTDTLVGAEGCTFDVIINCNVECVETSENPEMLTVSCTKGEGDVCIMTVTVAPNSSYDQVVGKIKVEFKDAEGAIIEGATAYFTVTQDGAEAPTFAVKGETALSVEYTEQLVTFEWETNCTVGEPATEADWITLDRQNATGARFVVAAFNLPCDSTRTATIAIPYTSATGEEFTQELTISQTAKTTFEPADIVGVWVYKLSGNSGVYQKGDYTFNADGTYTAVTNVYMKDENMNETDNVAINEETGLPYDPTTTEGTYTTTPLDGSEDEGVLFHVSTGGSEDWHVTYNFQTLQMTWTYTIKMNFGGEDRVLGQVQQIYTRVIE